MFPLASLHPCELVEIGNLSCDVNREMGGIKARNALYAGLAGEHGAAEGLFAEAIRADDTHSGDDDSRKHRTNQYPASSHGSEFDPTFEFQPGSRSPALAER